MPKRTIAIPVAEVVSGTKSEFYKDLRATLAASVRIANYCITECVKQDDFTQEKCGKIYTYPRISSLTPGCTAAASTIAHIVEKAYRAERWEVIRGKRSIRSFRSQPWPLLSNKSTSTFELVHKDEWIEAKLKLLGGWWTVRLKGSSNYRDQVKGLERAIKEDCYSDSKIWIDRRGVAIIGVVCEVEPRKLGSLSGSIAVHSAMDSLIKITSSRSETPFVINADECKQWQAWAGKRMQRLRQDRKSGVDRRRIQEQINLVSHKNQARFNTLCHEVSSMVVNQAKRQRCAEIIVDFTIKSFSKSFPWFKLASMIKYKAEDIGVSVTESTQSVVDPDVDKPHIYFKFSPLTNRVKIGKTAQDGGKRHGSETDCPDENLVILAVDNQPKAKLTAKEKHFHAMFAEYRISGVSNGKKVSKEWFKAEPVINWLRAVGWLGNAGNLSQVSQFVEVAV